MNLRVFLFIQDGGFRMVTNKRPPPALKFQIYPPSTTLKLFYKNAQRRMLKTFHLEHPPLKYIERHCRLRVSLSATYQLRLGSHIEGISLRFFELALVMSTNIRYHCSFPRRSPDI